MVKFNFHGDELDVIKEGETLWVSVRRVCEALGLNVDGQRVKLKDKEWACTEIISVHDISGRIQEIFMIDLDSLPMWLAGIDTGRANPEARPKLIAYQKECAKALRDYWFNGRVTNERARIGREDKTVIMRLREERLLEKQELDRWKKILGAWELTLKNFVDKSNIDQDLKQVYYAQYMEAATGKKLNNLLPAALPPDEKWYSAEEIALQHGLLATASSFLGRIANGIYGKQTRRHR